MTNAARYCQNTQHDVIGMSHIIILSILPLFLKYYFLYFMRIKIKL